MTDKLKIAISQDDYTVGAIRSNQALILKRIQEAQSDHADIIIFPELAISGYPPEDLLLRDEFHLEIQSALAKIQTACDDITVIMGYPEKDNHSVYNSALVIQNKERIANYRKQHLPNYSVFDENRYFTAGTEACLIEVNYVHIGIIICEDLWVQQPCKQCYKMGAQLVIVINASPFHVGKSRYRAQLAEKLSESGSDIAYINCIGGQDQLVFDGGSFYCSKGRVIDQAPFFQPGLFWMDYPASIKREIAGPLSLNEELHGALLLGIRDYVTKNGFEGVYIGISGGIDSALVAALAVEALGAERVTGVFMPSDHTSELSEHCVDQLVNLLGIDCYHLPIQTILQSYVALLGPEQAITGISEENLQARIRGNLLMAFSNEHHALVLATSNKSELSIGYTTLYGDLAGGFCPLKDLSKTLVYQLSEYLNQLKPTIPEAIINRKPTAELRPDQHDQQTLPPYPTLDNILERYIEREESVASLCEDHDPEMVKQVARWIARNEYKRRQAPLGIRLTSKGFGKDRRYPVTSGFITEQLDPQ